MSDLRETLTPGRDAGFGNEPTPKPVAKPALKKRDTKDAAAETPAPDEE